MRQHFSIGCFDCRKTARFRQSFHFSTTQVLVADHVHRRTGVHDKYSFFGLAVDGDGRHQFSESEKFVLCFSLYFTGYILPFSTLLHKHIALTFLSLRETDP